MSVSDGNSHAKCEARFAEQEREIDELRAELAYLRDKIQADSIVPPVSPPPPPSGRRPRLRVVRDVAPVAAIVAIGEWVRENKPAGMAVVAATVGAGLLVAWAWNDRVSPYTTGPEPVRPSFRTAPPTSPWPTATRTTTPTRGTASSTPPAATTVRTVTRTASATVTTRRTITATAVTTSTVSPTPTLTPTVGTWPTRTPSPTVTPTMSPTPPPTSPPTTDPRPVCVEIPMVQKCVLLPTIIVSLYHLTGGGDTP